MGFEQPARSTPTRLVALKTASGPNAGTHVCASRIRTDQSSPHMPKQHMESSLELNQGFGLHKQDTPDDIYIHHWEGRFLGNTTHQLDTPCDSRRVRWLNKRKREVRRGDHHQLLTPYEMTFCHQVSHTLSNERERKR